MANYNKVILLGNLTRDPEKRVNASGISRTEFGLAVGRKYTTQAGERREETCFVDIVTWRRLADTCEQYLSKGRPVLVDGILEYSSWEDRDGNKRNKLRVVAETVQFLGGAGGGGGGGGGQRDTRQAPARQTPPPGQQQQESVRDAGPGPSPDAGPREDDYNLDDIPF
jgi:single-strand DNA-binding protein